MYQKSFNKRYSMNAIASDKSVDYYLAKNPLAVSVTFEHIDKQGR